MKNIKQIASLLLAFIFITSNSSLNILYAEGDVYLIDVVEDEENIENTHISMVTVTFDANAEDMSMPAHEAVREISQNTSIGEDNMPNAPLRDGHLFMGWNTDRNAEGAEFNADTIVLANTTVYAVWEVMPTGRHRPRPPVSNIEVEVTFDSNASRFVSSNEIITYTLDIENIGNIETEDVIASIVFTSNAEFVLGSEVILAGPKGITFTVADYRLTFSIENIEAGELVSLAFDLKAPKPYGASFAVGAVVELVSIRESFTDVIIHTVSESTQMDLEILMTSNYEDESRVFATTNTREGSTIEYVVTIENTSVNYGSVLADIRVPDGTTYVEDSLQIFVNGEEIRDNDGGGGKGRDRDENEQGNRTRHHREPDLPVVDEDILNTIELDNIGPDDVIEIRFSVIVDELENGEHKRTYTNFATVNGIDTNEITHYAQVFISSATGEIVQIGDEVTYNINNVYNDFEAEVHNFTVKAFVPLGLDLISIRIPACLESCGLSYIIRYRTEENGWVQATPQIYIKEEMNYILPNVKTRDRILSVEILFGTVSSGFVLEAGIDFVFEVNGESLTVELENHGLVQFDTHSLSFFSDVL
ncbi:MAG: InlB B-repeat-containing protein [Defluviitaleaceae bacterium]|nr:InlB B-repeat-containing protein [Defluviitaleaceae bacterium]